MFKLVGGKTGIDPDSVVVALVTFPRLLCYAYARLFNYLETNGCPLPKKAYLI